MLRSLTPLLGCGLMMITCMALMGRSGTWPMLEDPEGRLAVAFGVAVSTSTDGGRTWAVVDSGLPAATWLTRTGDSLDLLIASGPAGAARSTDGGDTWTPLDVPAGVSLVEIAPEDPEVLYAGTHDGSAVRVQVSRDAGNTWSAT